MNRSYIVKKICKRSEMPLSSEYYTTAYTLTGTSQIYITPAGIYYATPPVMPK